MPDAAVANYRVWTEARIAEIARMLDAFPRDGEGADVGEIGTVDGYRVWSATYDDPGNPLIDVEEAHVRELLAGLPLGQALDAACGTGRRTRFLVERGHRAIGVDSSPDMLARARIRLPGTPFVRAGLDAPPMPATAPVG